MDNDALYNYAIGYLGEMDKDNMYEHFESDWARSREVLKDFINFVNTQTDPAIISARKKITEKEAEIEQLEKGLHELENKFEL